MSDISLPPFDPMSQCVKCGFSIPEPQQAEPKFGPKDASGVQKQLPAAPPPPPTPPTVDYCNGEDCWAAQDGPVGEHMHQYCDVCGFEWLSQPLA